MTVSEKVFVDSNYIIALFNPTDSNHKRAKVIAKKLEEQQTKLVLSNFIFLETVTVLSQRRGKEVASDVGALLKQDHTISIIMIDDLLNDAAWYIFQNVPYKNISFVDCSTIALMKTENLQRILTFDVTDFKKMHTVNEFDFFE